MEKISVQGLVATTPRYLKTQEGLDIMSFRLASSQRRYDKKLNRWVDGETNWYTITAFKQLALNTHKSINKGDRIMVAGELKVRDWDNGERAGTSVEIEAEALGHDLSWGESTFVRTVLMKEPESKDYVDSDRVKELEKQLKDLRDTLASLAEED